MSMLRERLHRLRPSVDNLDQDSSRSEELGEEWTAFDTVMEHTESGSFMRRVRRFPLDYEHGLYRLGLLTEASETLRMMTKSSHSIRYDQLLFLDTETTGLGVGAGNVPFMIGIGYYVQDAFVVDQLFIRNPGEELAMLMYLQSKLASYTHIVSYNGRTFDWPIIRNRFILNRVAFADQEHKHLDLLYPSRSLWRHILSSCRLSVVEQERLDLHREDDVPGSLAPTLYFQYLGDQQLETIRGVFEHNEQDILSLAGLLIHFSRVLQGSVDLSAMEVEELYRLAMWFDKLGLTGKTQELLDQLIEKPMLHLSTCLFATAAWYKKQRQYDKAVKLWENDTSFDACIELAKYYEHRQKNFSLAIHYAEEAREKMASRIRLSRGNAKHRELMNEVNKRITRLRNKQNK